MHMKGISFVSGVTALTEGISHKIHDVQGGSEELVIRLSLPVEEHYKSLSEVATIDWVRTSTSLPIPAPSHLFHQPWCIFDSSRTLAYADNAAFCISGLDHERKRAWRC